MDELLRSEIFLISMTFLLFWFFSWLQKRADSILLNPMILTIAVIIVFLKYTDISYEDYQRGGRYIEFWLQPAIVALGLPLYRELKNIRNQVIPVMISEITGCLTGIVSVVLIAKWLGATNDVICSLAPKSVSTPIAIAISQQIGGITALTSAIVVIVGMIGALIGLQVMRWVRVDAPISKSLGMGTAAHVIGTNRISQYGERYGAYSTLGLIINGILTAFLAGPIVEILLL